MSSGRGIGVIVYMDQATIDAIDACLLIPLQSRSAWIRNAIRAALMREAAR